MEVSPLLSPSDLLREILVSERAGEYRVAPERVPFKIKLCGFFFFFNLIFFFLPTFIYGMCVLVAVLLPGAFSSSSFFLRTQGDISTFLWMNDFAKMPTCVCVRACVCVRVVAHDWKVPRRPRLVAFAFRSRHIFSQLRDWSDKCATHVRPSPPLTSSLHVPPVLSSSSAPLCVCPPPTAPSSPFNYTLLGGRIKGTDTEDLMRVILALLCCFFSPPQSTLLAAFGRTDMSEAACRGLYPASKWAERWFRCLGHFLLFLAPPAVSRRGHDETQVLMDVTSHSVCEF